MAFFLNSMTNLWSSLLDKTSLSKGKKKYELKDFQTNQSINAFIKSNQPIAMPFLNDEGTG